MSLFCYYKEHRNTLHFCYNYKARKTFGWTNAEKVIMDHHSAWVDIICISYYKFPKWSYVSESGSCLPWWANDRCRLFKDVKNAPHMGLML